MLCLTTLSETPVLIGQGAHFWWTFSFWYVNSKLTSETSQINRLMRALRRRQYYQAFDFYFVLQLAPTEITTYHDFLNYFQKSDADSPRERRGIETVLPWTHREPEDVTFNHISDFFERFVIEINFGRTFSVSSEMPGRSLAVRTLLPRFQ